ncbi:MAG: Fur family transcriptional regulator [Chloroflexota bacterium]
MRLTEKKLSVALKKQGYKMTPQRRAVLNVVAASHSHLSPGEIHQQVRQEHPNIGVVTVYRTLEVLVELGLVCQVHAGGSSRSYLLRRPAEHHHHLVCSGCGTVVDFTYCEMKELEERLSHETGFKVEEHLLECFGRCPNCR